MIKKSYSAKHLTPDTRSLCFNVLSCIIFITTMLLPINFFKLGATAAALQYTSQIDLSDANGSLTLPLDSGYSFSGNTLTFNADANGQAYKIYQSDTEVASKIIFNTGVDTTVTIENINISSGIELQGTAILNLLLEGVNEIAQTLLVPINSEITIDSARSTSSQPHNTSGFLKVTATGRDNAAIGSDTSGNSGTTTINGGTITVESILGAGIGGGNGRSGRAITVNGGIINATSTTDGAGIGGGNRSRGENIIITGGTINTNTRFGAGIGSGSNTNTGQENITITGGTINATASHGAGIGGGNWRAGGNITITGGTINASSQFGSAIGGGSSGGLGATIHISSDVSIKAYSNGDKPAIQAINDNDGNGCYVNALLNSGNFNAGPLRVYADGNMNTILTTLNVPSGYRSFAFQIPGSANTSNYNVYVQETGGHRAVLRATDDSHVLYSINGLDGYDVHNISNPGEGWLPVKLNQDLSSWLSIDLANNDTSLHGTVANNWAAYYEYNTITKVLTIKQDAPPGHPLGYRVWNSDKHEVAEILVNTAIITRITIDNLTLNGNINIQGTADVKLLLKSINIINGSILAPRIGTNNAKITIDSSASTLENPNSTNGSLEIKVVTPRFTGIGGASNQGCGNITIDGGTLDITGDTDTTHDGGPAAIGGSRGGACGPIIINGGNVTARNYAGLSTVIGPGRTTNGGSITINGGTVNVNGGGAGIGSPAGGNGATITINGGTVNSQSSEAAIGGINNTVIINNGTVNATSTHGAAVGGNTGSAPNLIEIYDGNVTATTTGRGAAIGGGGSATSTGIAGGSGIINIYGGRVNATTPSRGAAIGGGGCGGSNGSAGGNCDVINIYDGDITATAGSTIANSGGVGIGGGGTAAGSGGSGGTVNIYGGNVIATSIGDNVPAIGGGLNGTGARLYVDAATNLKAYSNGTKPAIDAINDNNDMNATYVNSSDVNQGPSSFVNAICNTNITGPLQIYANSNASTVLDTLNIPINHRSFAYTTGESALVNHNIYVQESTGIRPIIRVQDNDPVIYSVSYLSGYDAHNNNAGNGWLPVKLSSTVYPIVTEKYVDINGNPLIGKPDSLTLVTFATYSKIIPGLSKHLPVGYKWDTPPNSSGTNYTDGNPIDEPVSASRTIYFVYEPSPCWLNIDLANSDTSLYGTAAKDWINYYEYNTVSRILTIKQDALDDPNAISAEKTRAYRIWQSGNHDVAEIAVNTGVETDVTIDGINLIGNINLKGTADVKLLLRGTNTINGSVVAAATIDGNLVVGAEHAGIAKIAKVTIDSSTESGSEKDILTVTSQSHEFYAGIGGPGGTGGTVVLDGGTITATGSGSAQGIAGNVTINSGMVTAFGGSGTSGIGGDSSSCVIIINGGIVNATGGEHGAGIGGGRNAAGLTTIINGGEITANGGVNGGAGIGGGAGLNLRSANFTINGGKIIATGGARGGAGIGGGFRGGSDTVTITGGEIIATGGASGGAGVGSGLDSFWEIGATIHIDAAANVKAYAFGTDPAIDSINDNTGDGYYVNATLNSAIAADSRKIQVYAEDDTNTQINTLNLPGNYRNFAYTAESTTARTDNLYVYHDAIFIGHILRLVDDQTQIYSVNTLDGYNMHNNNAGNGVLPVKFDPNYIIKYKANNNLSEPNYTQITAVSDGPTPIIIKTYSEIGFTPPTDMIFHSWNTEADGSGSEYAAGSNIEISNNLTLFAKWIPATTTLTITKEITGEYADITKSFTFEVYFNDGTGSALNSGTILNYTGDVIAGYGANAPPDGALTLGDNGKASFPLLNGQCITIEKVPSDGSIRIIETEAGGYTVYFKDSEETTLELGIDTGTRAMTSHPRTFDFTNARNQIVPGGIILSIIIGAILLGAIGLIVKLIIDRHKKARGLT